MRLKEVLARCGIVREKGYMYFIDKRGDISRVKQARGRKAGATDEPQHVWAVGVHKEAGWLYFVDADGNACRARMKRFMTPQ